VDALGEHGRRPGDGSGGELDERCDHACDDREEEAVLAEKIRSVMAGESWEVQINFMYGDSVRTTIADIRSRVFELELRDHEICMKLNANLQPYNVYQALLDIPWETAGLYPAVLTAVDTE
jgi:hypothetical protein